jgi:hypothetical protein
VRAQPNLGFNYTLTVTGSQILRNHATQYGGGIENAALGSITLTQSPVDDNHPDNCAPQQSVLGCAG